MALPLQPDLRPPPPWMKRIAGLLALALAVVVLGLWADAHRSPPRLLTSDSGEEAFVGTVLRHIDQAEERVWVMVYVLYRERSETGPVTELVNALQRAVQRGVAVRVVLDQSRVWGSEEVDDKHVAAAAWLESLGIPVLIDDLNRTTHAKTILIDTQTVIIGSHNWTFSALSRNVELSLIVHDRGIAREVEAVFTTIPGW